MTAPSSVSRCTMHAPAKLNLRLDLLGKRDDGFHELKTVMTTVGLCDTVRVEAIPESSAIRLRLLGASEGVPADDSNLVVRALRMLQDASGTRHGASVTLVKRIPSQAGLGGGSSDTAAALAAANRVWGLDWDAGRLAEVGARIGSDVPFFVHAILNPTTSAALATGRGEVVTPFACRRRLGAVVVKPEAGLSTPAVYSACKSGDYADPSERSACEELAGLLRRGRWSDMTRLVRNGLQPAARRLAPWIDQVASAFDSARCTVHQLSGSGSAYFGLTRSVAESRRVAATLRALRVGQLYATVIG